jgi:hypothetical protein
MKPHRGKRPDRAGYALVLFLMMVFGLMGLAVLVIDLGFARLAQRQMQTAVDSAALEGLRWRDDPMLDPTLTDQARRQKASDMVANVFDDDLDPTNGDTGQFGAGPVVDFTGGVGPAELVASQTMSPGVPPVYKPKRADGTPGLELNLGDAQNGDMASGTYGSNPDYDVAHPADEDANYNRRDFRPSAGTATSVPAPAFLVRMRRTPLWNVSGSLDDTPGVSSAGPPLPFLFGRGTSIHRQEGAAYSPRRDGITVRAAAIAAVGSVTGLSQTPCEVGRAKAAGPPYQGIDANNNPVNIPGTTPFSITVGAWNSMPANVPQAFQSSSGSGDIQWFGNSPTSVIQIGQPMSVMGGTSTPLAIGGATDILTQSGYVPIYATVPLGGQSSTIIGFAYVRWNWNAASRTLTLTKGPSGTRPVGCGNISGVLVLALPASFSQQDVTTLFQLHAGAVTDPTLVLDNLTNSVYAPVLVNRYIGPNQSSP